MVDVTQYITPETFEFQVEVDGTAYDVFWFEMNGKVGQFAFTVKDEVLHVAMLKAGRRTQKEVTDYIARKG
jgi:hypothetical protein